MQQHNRRRVAVTGIGAVSAAGIGRQALEEAFFQGQSAAGPLSRFTSSNGHCRVACEVREFDPRSFADAKLVRFSERASAYALASAKLAVQDAGSPERHWDPGRVGVCMGTMIGAIELGESQLAKVHAADNIRKLHPFMAIRFFAGNIIGLISINLGIRGRCLVFSNLELSASNAISHGFRCIRHGMADAMLVGGTEAPLTPLLIEEMSLAGLLTAADNGATSVPYPFDDGRDGMVLGEGAAVLLLEDMELARTRGARIYAELCGCGHDFGMNGSGRRAMEAALASGGIASGDVDAVGATGASTVEDDLKESADIRSIFGGPSARAGVGSVSATVGHTLGAVGAFQAAASVLSIENRVLFPVANLKNPDRHCGLNLVVREPVEADVSVALQYTRALTGAADSLVFRRADR